MSYPLAKLDDLKASLGFSGAGHDAELQQLLLDATSLAETLVGVPASGLRRAVDRVEYPTADRHGQLTIRTHHWPVESITEIKLAYLRRVRHRVRHPCRLD